MRFKVIKIINPDGFVLQPSEELSRQEGKPMFYCISHKQKPVSLLTDKGILTLDRTFATDGLSTPAFLHAIPGMNTTDWPVSSAFHDCCCKEGGLYLDGVFVDIPRSDADLLIRDIVPVEGRDRGKIFLGIVCSPLIYIGVRIGAFLGIGVPKNENKGLQKNN